MRTASSSRMFSKVRALQSTNMRGVWNAENQYNEGDVATHDGSAFIAKKSTRDKPGTSDSWQLMVKRGKDGKDAK